ncbi:helix-turn-helix transcriptional regulator [Streptomyces sp. NPDC044780]|uniref:Helix-turn-helix transcriptional regulator n=1 Tax=Streptomyces luomodiensis TaxID=3026192 RepID=A0ABY9V940_9ACTN|nr:MULTISPECIES: helix-turn-helix transcriptional regulator [unclassified Streptomyces]WAP59874.1 helix-turn-helix transcriptional regulator [Streptomyces sp. S465]WNF00501.1 helix-turn-helix transcriptional regulator [Streptomyces sp. SCA4-21]
MDSENSLGRFLRARRERVRPEDVGILPGSRRRVAGLRREEVALLSGVSTDYYVRLEQGRERHPSAQVVEALARALVLEEDAAAHLHRLARPAPVRRRPAARRERVSPALLRMMEGWPRTPAVVLGRCLTVLAHNALGGALFDGHTHSRDLMRLVFLDPDAREFYPDWDRVAVNTVAGLRAAAGIDEEDPELIAVVGELSLKSETFRRLWARHDIRQKTHETKRFRHRLVGELTLEYEALTVNSAPGQQLIVYQAEPGSPSEQALALLGSLTADAVEAPHRVDRTTTKDRSI